MDNKVASRVTNTVELLDTIKDNKQTAEFAVVTPEQLNLINTVHIAILSMILEYWKPGSDHVIEGATQNEPTQTKKQQILVHYAKNYWQEWGSYYSTGKYSQCFLRFYGPKGIVTQKMTSNQSPSLFD